MIFDWILREGWIVFNWWLIISLMGMTVLPALTRLLPALPDNGYTLARPVGLLLIAFVYWFLSVLGFINNSVGSIIFAWGVVLIGSIAAYSNIKTAFNWRNWWRENKPLVIAVEVLFVVLLVGFAVYRAHNNGLTHTEQPMDLAFMSAIQHSAQFPPNDPWLAGYTISYYYFGYVMAAMNAMLAGVPSTIGYNMHLALLFALVGTTAFGVTYNLVRSRGRQITDNGSPRQKRRIALGFGLLGMTFLLLMSNFHLVFVELPYRNQLFDDGYYQFWDTKNRTSVPENPTPDLTQARWWWFDHSRTITERTLPVTVPAGVYYFLDGEQIRATEPITLPTRQTYEVIDEFPAFSFVLGDSHPHVMALPFVLLALGLALNVLLSDRPPDPLRTVFYGLCIGGLIFLNTWDAPVYLIVIVGAEAVRRVAAYQRLTFDDLLALALFGGALLGVMLAAYFPFLVGFTSQLGGVLANVVHPTRPQQLFLMFGPFILLLAVYLGFELWRGRRLKRMNWSLAALLVGSIFGVLIFAMILLTAVGMADPTYNNLVQTIIRQDIEGPRTAWDALNPAIFARRFEALPALIVIGAALFIAFARLFPATPDPAEDDEKRPFYTPTTGFSLLLIVCGVGLVLVPEFVYLRDNFSTRMNTIFKFYYQAWVLFSIAAAYGVYSIVIGTKGGLRIAYSALTIVVLSAGLLYFPLGVYSRAYHEAGFASGFRTSLTLDGGPSFVGEADYQAIMCLQEIVGRRQVVVAEANPQGSFVNYNPAHGRVGSLTGIPIIIGWPGHQEQWRGLSYREVVGTRRPDLDLLFRADRLDMVQNIIDYYDISYIFYGSTERGHYGTDGERKFFENYAIVCEANVGGNIARVYRVSRPATDVLTSNR